MDKDVKMTEDVKQDWSLFRQMEECEECFEPNMPLFQHPYFIPLYIVP